MSDTQWSMTWTQKIIFCHSPKDFWRYKSKKTLGDELAWCQCHYLVMGQTRLTNVNPCTDLISHNLTKIFFKKGQKLCFLLKKHLILFKKNRLRIWGVPPPPLSRAPFTDKIRKVVFEVLPNICWILKKISAHEHLIAIWKDNVWY